MKSVDALVRVFRRSPDAGVGTPVPAEPEAWPRYFVKHPVSFGGLQHLVRVVGGEQGEFYIVPRGRVIEISPAAGEVIGKWRANLCIEPYAPDLHEDAVLVSPAPVEPCLPAWTREAEPGRALEREMIAMEAKARDEMRRQG